MTRWYTEKKREFFYNEAKRQGYRARSSFKLKQLQKRFTIIHPGDLVIDLGAAPGGWSQIAQELTGPTGHVIGIDLHHIQPLDTTIFIQGDITEPATQHELEQQMPKAKADVILSDMSPNISGNYSVDQARSAWLCEQALSIAKTFLRDGGTFICKLFEGEDSPQFLEHVKDAFTHVKQYNPQASRKSSSEKYIVGKYFRNK
jgi:23S rRNA (uridine2552-2'-O)-methyltransferase